MTRTRYPDVAQANRGAAVMHVRFAGRSFDLPLAGLSVGIGAADDQLKRAVAAQLEVLERRLDDYVIDRHANGNLTLRPQAVFG